MVNSVFIIFVMKFNIVDSEDMFAYDSETVKVLLIAKMLQS